jgi:hypothetical protein
MFRLCQAGRAGVDRATRRAQDGAQCASFFKLSRHVRRGGIPPPQVGSEISWKCPLR